MAPLHVSASLSSSLPLLSPPLSSPSLNRAPSKSIGCSFVSVQRFPLSRKTRKQLQVVSMAPEEEKLTRRNPLDFPIEWERPKPGRRPDIFPKFSPMKSPLPPPMPYDPPEEDDEEEEKKEEETEDDPDKEDEDQPNNQ
ncbi:PREDICTED: podocalyxin-like protein 2 [Camelina sativa]|uniref:Podocalyxin-like protein 2 n=1 Tax=Camelina sativa TaxID=90675 RepID=A0ABM0XNK2_CAMSA|nr:PREDICTED: podocalyxin-like protein 2 [Camelina sativa]